MCPFVNKYSLTFGLNLEQYTNDCVGGAGGGGEVHDEMQYVYITDFHTMFWVFFIVNNNIVLYINTFHTETGLLCQVTHNTL